MTKSISAHAEPLVAARAFWSAIDAVATPAFTLVTLAALVRALGASDYGIMVIALAASGLSMAVNPAIAATTTKFISELSGPRGFGGRTIAGVITLSLMIVVAIDLVLLLVTAVFNKPLSAWIFGAPAGSDQLGQVLLLALLSVGIQQIDAVLGASLKGLERFRRQAMIEVSSRGVLTAVVIFVAWSTRSVEDILIAQCAMSLASMLVRAAVLRTLLPDHRIFGRFDTTEAARLIRYSGWMWLTALAGVAYTSLDRIMVGRSLGAAVAGQYNIYLQVTQVIHFIPSSVFAFSLPAFSRLDAGGAERNNEIARSYRAYLIAISVSAGILAAAMMMCWPELMRVFAGTGFKGTDGMAPRLLILNFLLLACNVAPYYLLIALGHARSVSMITVISMSAALALMMILIPRYGVEGAAVARLAYGAGALLLLQRAQQLLKRK
jgi:O-antigen/teichoic acid export membrane protein